MQKRVCAILVAASVASAALHAGAGLLRFATGYPSQAATAGNPGLVSGWQSPPVLTYAITAFELTVTQQTRIDQFACVGNTPTPQLHPFRVIVHSSLAAFAANPLNGNIYSSTAWNINSQQPFGAGAGALGMAWNYYTLVNPPGADIVLNPGTYAITIYRDNNWRFADSDIDLGTDWAATNSFPGQIFPWESGAPSGTAAIDVYGRFVDCPADLNLDTFVDDADFVLFAPAYNLLLCSDPAMPATCPADLNADAMVDDADFVLFAAAYEVLLCP
jgi:hypothetical protein